MRLELLEITFFVGFFPFFFLSQDFHKLWHSHKDSVFYRSCGVATNTVCLSQKLSSDGLR